MVSLRWLRLSLFSFITLAIVSLTGCFGGPAPVKAPEWDVEAIGTACMAQVDTDGDGFITKSEAKENAPGLNYALQQLDLNGDKKLDIDEIKTRFQDLKDSKTGVQGFSVKMSYKGRPLPEAEVRLVPEAFLGGAVEEAEGTVIDSYTGQVDFDIPGDEFYGVRPGMYRIEVRSDAVKIPPKYNDETTLGVDVAPFTNPFEEAGGIQIKLK